MERLRDSAVLAQVVGGFEARLDPYAERARNAARGGRFSLAIGRNRSRDPEDALDQSFAHAELARLLRGGLRAQQLLSTQVVPAVGWARSLGQADERLQSFSPLAGFVGLHAGSVQCATDSHAAPQEHLMHRL